jgi:hypothetical protein
VSIMPGSIGVNIDDRRLYTRHYPATSGAVNPFRRSTKLARFAVESRLSEEPVQTFQAFTADLQRMAAESGS